MLQQYFMNGLYDQAGLQAHSVGLDGRVTFEGFNSHVTGMQINKGVWDHLPKGERRMKWGMSGLGLGFSALQVATGYQLGGMGGAWQAFITDQAASAGVARWGYGSPGTRGPTSRNMLLGDLNRVGLKVPGTMLSNGGFLSTGARYVGANLGAQVGYMALGAPGALVGGFFGAAPIASTYQLASKHPMIGMAGVGLAAGAMMAKGAYAVSKEVVRRGGAYARGQRGVNTDGDMSAFMTQGATTMRARAIQAMNRSHVNSRSALGQEATMISNPARGYSRYV